MPYCMNIFHSLDLWSMTFSDVSLITFNAMI